MKLPWKHFWASLALVTAAVSSAASDNFPNKSVRLIVPYASGNVTDIVGREVANALAQRWGQSIVVVNMAGAGGALLHCLRHSR